MKFTTPCFVRVEDADEREKLDIWLRRIGRKTLASKIKSYTVASEDSILWCNLDGCTIDVMISQGYIDCGTDIELFKALAAMNDENDREQWFTDGTEWWLSEVNNFDSCMTTAAECEADNVGYYTYCQEYGIHKATPDEIIEHFKLKART